MNLNVLPRIRSCFFLSMLPMLLYSIDLSAQQQKYDSVYQPILGYSGNAVFTYSTNKSGDIIKEGDFLFRTRKQDSTCLSDFSYEEWRGKYANNQKTGDWLFAREDHQVHLKDVTETDVNYDLTTHETTINAHYEDGVPDREWRIESVLYRNRKPERKTELFQTTFREKRIHGPVKFQYSVDSTRSCTITGNTKNGLMDSIWNFNYTIGDSIITEQRIYKSGILTRLVKMMDGDTLNSLNYPLSPELLQAIETNDFSTLTVNHPVSLSFSDGYPRTSEYTLAQQSGNSFLDIIIAQLFRYDPEFIPTNGLPIGTNRGFYVMNAREKNLLEKWPEVEYQYREKIQQLKAQQAENYKFRDNNELKNIAAWTARQEYILEYIKPWNNILSKNELEFYNRRGELVRYAQNLLAADTINKKEKTVIQYRASAENSQDFLSYITFNFGQRIQTADSLLNQYGNLTKGLMLADEIALRKKNIEIKKDSIDTSFLDRTKDEAINNMMDSLNTLVANTYNQKYELFTATGSGESNRQQELIDSMQYLLNIRENIHNTAIQIAERKRQIDTLYTEYTFDPFTFNDRFPRRIKKKLYEVIAEDLVKEMIESAMKADTPLEAQKRVQQIYEIQERLIFLHDKDTRKLERKLKRGDSIEKKLELFKV